MTSSPTMQLQHARAMKITPQMRQAIGLLQMNNRALAAFVAIHAASNPYLKIVTAGDPPAAAPGGLSEAARSGPESRHDVPPSAVKPSGDSGWQETEQSIAAPAAGLYEHVRRQIDLSIRDPRQKGIAYFLTEALDPNGWLSRPLARIASEAGCSVEEAETVLTVLQGLEPAGLFARSLSECLRLQALEAGVLTDVLSLVLDNLELVGRGDLERLARLGKTTPDVILAQVKTIKRFNPKPGAAYDSAPSPLVPPDLVARGREGEWQVELNRSNLPAVTVRDGIDLDDPRYSGLPDKERLLAEARWLEKAVARRNVTTLTIAAEIVRRQTGFLAQGPSHLVPMSIADIALAVSVHESTVSRVTSGLMITTPRGTVTLREFFSVGLPRDNGEDSVSSAAVRDEIRRMINDEAADDPISDEALAAHFKDRGISVARRTVAKYRDMLGIPGSAARKRRARLSKGRTAR